MSSKFATLGALSAGGMTVGAVATVSVMLLTGGSTFSEMSDIQALEKGFAQIFESQETCKYLEILENLEGKPISNYLDMSINNIYGVDELLGVNFGYTMDTDSDSMLFTAYGDSPELPFDGPLSGTVYVSPEMFAVASNAFSKYITVSLDTFVEDYNSSYLATLTGPIEEDELFEIADMDMQSISDTITKLMADVDSIDTTELEKNMKAQFENDIDILFDHMNTSRSDDSVDINGFDAYKVTVSVDSSYILKIFYNQLAEIIGDKNVQDYINKLYTEMATINGSDKDRNIATELTAGLALAYGTFEEEFKEAFGEEMKLYVYFTEDADICRIEFPMNFTSTIELEDDSVVMEDKVTIAVDFLGSDDIYSEYAFTYAVDLNDGTKGVLECSKKFKDDSTVYTFKVSNGTEIPFKATVTNTTTNDTFKNSLKVFGDGIEVISANFNGTYKLTDNSIDVNVSKITIDAASLPILDMTLKFGISENTKEITIPTDKSINLTDMQLDDIVDIADEIGTFLGKPGLGEEIKSSIEAMIAVKELGGLVTPSEGTILPMNESEALDELF